MNYWNISKIKDVTASFIFSVLPLLLFFLPYFLFCLFPSRVFQRIEILHREPSLDPSSKVPI